MSRLASLLFLIVTSAALMPAVGQGQSSQALIQSALAAAPGSIGSDASVSDLMGMAREQPQVEALGLAYMLSGGSDASNTDPFATEPAPGSTWIDSGPHVMLLVPDARLLPGTPRIQPTVGPT